MAGFQLSRNLFLIFALYNPCMTIISTLNCKLQEFPLLFCYIHAAVLAFVLAIQAVRKYT